MKKNLTVTRGEVGGEDGGKGEGFSGTTIKDTWPKPRGVEAGEGGGVGGKCRQLYLNNKLISKKQNNSINSIN